jgi:bifunctional non-homologous end joining protein LigD
MIQDGVSISNPDKVLFPDSGITKREFVEYHSKISKYMVPLIKDRPLTMYRFPDGIKKGSKGFFSKNRPDYFPDWIGSVEIGDRKGVKYVICDSKKTLVYLAGQVATLHVSPLCKDNLDAPDLMLFDLDPVEEGFDKLRKAAGKLKELIETIGLVPFVKSSGSRGLHIEIPIKAELDTDRVKAFALDIALALKSLYPKDFTAEHRKDKRDAAVLIDVWRNSPGQTIVAPYAVRAIEGAPVAAPLFWEEIEEKGFHAQKFNIKNIVSRLEKKGDPWKGFNKSRNSLKKAIEKLSKTS